ncbi:hypothetical protein [uncultured Corynebacterium sp.]|uniref:alcohol dehydrogenase catalytic domain-containing protein n=1 Tax=uncultured Corynebacterium sp. TaxID=159447 RepID=UPI0025F153DA|nr:hypothetical protein [uncultured Corynebacterium sp.]
MKAAGLHEPGPIENLRIEELPIPEPQPGWVSIRIRAFGINRSEYHTRVGLAHGMTFPCVLGIETSGEADLDTTGSVVPDRKVMTMMDGMGRTSAVEQAAAVLAKQAGATVLSTTRSESKRPLLEQLGVDHVIIDDGNIA